MSNYSLERAVGCRIGYNTVIKAARFIDRHDRIPPWASKPLRGVLKAVYGVAEYKRLRHRRAKLRIVA